jgi:hypothetical protein
MDDDLEVTWQRAANIPTATSSPRIVKIKDFVFVGGGNHMTSIFRYSIIRDKWITLLQCPAYHQGLTTLNEELISVGGRSSQGVTNTVYTFRDEEWKEVLPPILTPRMHLIAVSHNNELIVAAGGSTDTDSDGSIRTIDTVEVYIHNRQWYAIKQLSIPFKISSTCVMDDTCYMFGVREALHISLPNLMKTALQTNDPNAQREWKMLRAEQPIFLSSLVELDGKLAAMGGSCDGQLRVGTTYISFYDSTADTWVGCKRAQLPASLYKPGVVKLAADKVMVIGGQPRMQQFSNKVYIGTSSRFYEEISSL